MIQSKADLRSYLVRDMQFYHGLSVKDKIVCRIVKDPAYEILQYIRALRKEEYYFNCGKGWIDALLGFWFLRKKNRIGNSLGFKIPRNTTMVRLLSMKVYLLVQTQNCMVETA